MLYIVCPNCRSNLYQSGEIKVLAKSHPFHIEKVNFQSIDENLTLKTNNRKLDLQNEAVLCPKCGHQLNNSINSDLIRFDIKINEVLMYPFFLKQEFKYFKPYIFSEDKLEEFHQSTLGRTYLEHYNKRVS